MEVGGRSELVLERLLRMRLDRRVLLVEEVQMRVEMAGVVGLVRGDERRHRRLLVGPVVLRAVVEVEELGMVEGQRKVVRSCRQMVAQIVLV